MNVSGQYRILAIDDEEHIHATYDAILGTDRESENHHEELDQLMALALTPPAETAAPETETNYRLDHAYQGEEGYQQVLDALEEGDPYAVIYVDIQMPPGWNGIQTAHKIMRADPLVRIILITAYTSFTVDEIREEIGVDFNLLNKPFNHDELLNLTQLQTHKWSALVAMEVARKSLLSADEALPSRYRVTTADGTSPESPLSRHDNARYEALLLEKAQYELILESIQEGVVVINRTGKIEYLNRSVERLSGRSDSALLGEGLSKLFCGELCGEEKEQNSLFPTTTLPAIQQQLQALIDRDEVLFHNWLNSALIATLLVGANGRVAHANAAMTGLTGWTKTQLVGNPLDLLVPPGLRSSHSGQLEHYFDAPEARRMGGEEATVTIHTHNRDNKKVEVGLLPLQIGTTAYTLVVLNDPAEQYQWQLFQLTPFGRLFSNSNSNSNEEDEQGSYNWQLKRYGNGGEVQTLAVHVTGSPLYLNEGAQNQFIGAVLVLHDISTLLNQESRRQVSKAKEDFLATISHELRTPLSGILGNCDLLRERSLGSEEQRLVGAISTSGQNLMLLIGDILDYSRIQSGKLALEEQGWELNRLCAELMQQFSTIAAERNLQLEHQPRFQSSQPLLGDGNRLQQILRNLLSNAVKFSTSGTITFTTSRSQDGNRLHFAVQDEGIGIPSSAQKRLFQPFEQIDGSLSRRHGGTGLGLYLSSQLAEMMGGTIEVESSEGAGSRFTLTIPYRASQPVRSRQPLPSRFSGTVLVAEDTPVMCTLVKGLLESMGITVTTAENGAIAMELALQHSYDLILMDMQMPVMDGIESTETLRTLGYSKPIVALTANVMPEYRDRFFQAGCNEFLNKPINRSALKRILQRFLLQQENSTAAPQESEELVVSSEARALFSQQLTRARETLPVDLENQAWDRLRTTAHNLKGSAATFGRPELTELGREICNRIDQAQFSETTPLIERLLQQLNQRK